MHLLETSFSKPTKLPNKIDGYGEIVIITGIVIFHKGTFKQNKVK